MASNQTERNWEQAVTNEDYDTAADEAQIAREVAQQDRRETAYVGVYHDPASPLFQGPETVVLDADGGASAPEVVTNQEQVHHRGGRLPKNFRALLEVALQSHHATQPPANPVSRAVLEGKK